MMDWVVISTIAAPVLSLFLGAWLDRQFEAKAKLIAFLRGGPRYVAGPRWR